MTVAATTVDHVAMMRRLWVWAITCLIFCDMPLAAKKRQIQANKSHQSINLLPYGSPTVGLFLCYQHIFAIFKHQAVVIIRSKNDTNVQTLGSPNIYWSKVDVDTSTHPAVTLPQ